MDPKTVFYDWYGANLALFYAANQVTGDTYEQFMLLGSALGKYTLFPVYFVLILLAAWYTTRTQKYNAHNRRKWIKTILTLLFAYGLSWAWVSPLKHALQMPRPFALLPEGSVHILPAIRQMEAPLASFPSGHCAFAMTLVASLWPVLNLPWRIAGAFFVIWVGISRIALGVHFPADVLGTFLLALLAVNLVRFLTGKIYPAAPEYEASG